MSDKNPFKPEPFAVSEWLFRQYGSINIKLGGLRARKQHSTLSLEVFRIWILKSLARFSVGRLLVSFLITLERKASASIRNQLVLLGVAVVAYGLMALAIWRGVQ